MLLAAHSYFSLRYGTLSLEEMLEKAKSLGYSSFALTDINNSSGVLDYVRLCQKNGIQAIVGMEFRHNNEWLFTAIAKNNEGFRQINEWMSLHSLGKKKMERFNPGFSDAFVVYPFGSKDPSHLEEDEFLGVEPWQISQLGLSKYRKYQKLFTAFHRATFTSKAGHELHRHLRAIELNTVLSRVEPGQMASQGESWLHADLLRAPYHEMPHLLKTSENILSRCGFEFDFKTVKNKQTFTGTSGDDVALLRQLSFDGMEYRYGLRHQEAKRRIEHELELIVKLGFASYFLITWDIIRYTLSKSIYHVGRGSGANSIVAYCLKITDVDPIELNLYFERFINPKRTSPPDFDIDFSWKDRDMVQDYIFEKYGTRHAALLGAMVTFQGRSILRELGKVYGLPKTELDAFVEDPGNKNLQSEITSNILKYGRMMQDFPNIRSIHAGGIIISELPLSYYTALDLPPKGYPTTQWDMYTSEDIGFEKLDILSQRGIGHIQESVEIVLRNRGEIVDVHNIPKFKTDLKTRAQIKKGETIGCFYIESPAMRGLLKKLRCSDYITLVAASSIIRPGVAQSGMMREYIWRFHNPGKFSYIHPVMEQQLKETYGVMVYQEDVLKICHHFAGLDLADADILRRVMSGKPRFKNEFEKIVNRFFSNCDERAYPPETTKEVWRQIESFAGYSFSKAHSASYAAESFQSLFLKAYYPIEFMVAVINNFGGFYRSWVYFNEARRCGANIKLPCVNKSELKTCVHGTDIYIGFVHLLGLETKIAENIVNERERNGIFTGLEDFISRLPIGREQIVLLIRSGAFSFTGIAKPQLLWQAHMYLNKEKPVEKPLSIFKTQSRQFSFPELSVNPIEDAYDEIELLGFPVSQTWFDMLQSPFRGQIKAHEMLQYKGKTLRMLGTLVTIKYVWTKKREIMHFATFIDDLGNFFDSVHFPKTLQEYPFKGHGVYLLLGTITDEFDYPSLQVQKMAKMPLKPDPRFGGK